MKVRMGFVSNSSSSSFVVFGFKTNYTPELEKKILTDVVGVKCDGKDEDEINDMFYDHCREEFPRVLRGSDDGVDEEGKAILGFTISDISSSGDDDMEEKEFDFEKILSKVQAMAKTLGLNDVKMKIYTGIRSC